MKKFIILQMVFWIVLNVWSTSTAQQTTVYPLSKTPIYPHKGVSRGLDDKLPHTECGKALKAISADMFWYYVETTDGTTGYVRKRFLTENLDQANQECLKDVELLPKEETRSANATIPAKVYVIKPVKLYGDAIFKRGVVAEASPGDTLSVEAQKGYWYRVQTPEAKEGWIAKDWVSTNFEDVKPILAEIERRQAQKKHEIDYIEKRLKSIPETKFKLKADLYRELLDLDPGKESYQKQLKRYEVKVQQQIRASEAASRKKAAAEKASRDQRERDREKQQIAKGYVLKLISC